MTRPFLMLYGDDNLILGMSFEADPDDGPIMPQVAHLEGIRLKRFDGEFTRAGRRDTEAAYLVDDAIEWRETSTLEQAKAISWDRAKVARDKAEAAPIEFEGSYFDPNKENISGAALAALLAQLAGQEIADEWTLADNTRKTLTGPQIIALGQALTQCVKAIHARGRQLRDLIDNAATPAEAYGYTWESLDV